MDARRGTLVALVFVLRGNVWRGCCRMVWMTIRCRHCQQGMVNGTSGGEEGIEWRDGGGGWHAGGGEMPHHSVEGEVDTGGTVCMLASATTECGGRMGMWISEYSLCY